MPREKSQSFAAGVKDELVRLPVGKSCCQLSEIGALTQTSGHLSFRSGGKMAVTYRVENTGAARRLFQLLKTRLGVSPMLHYTQTRQLGGRRTWVLTLNEEDSHTLLTALHMAETDEEIALEQSMLRMHKFNRFREYRQEPFAKFGEILVVFVVTQDARKFERFRVNAHVFEVRTVLVRIFCFGNGVIDLIANRYKTKCPRA